MASTLVSVIIPTQRRPLALQTAARSAMRQGLPPPSTMELVIVDNDEAGSARSVAASASDCESWKPSRQPPVSASKRARRPAW